MSAEKEVGSGKMEECSPESPETKEVVENETAESETKEMTVESETVTEKNATAMEEESDDNSETVIEDKTEVSETAIGDKNVETETVIEDVSEESQMVVEENIQESETVVEENSDESETVVEKNGEESETVIEKNCEDSEMVVEGNVEDSEMVADGNGEESEMVAEGNGEESEMVTEGNGEESEMIGEGNGEESEMVTEGNGEESETIIEEHSEESKASEDAETVVEEKSDNIEEETVESATVNEEDQSSSKCSRELKALLELSKEAKLDTNIIHKRKSVDPKKLFNRDNLLGSPGAEVAADKPDAAIAGVKRKYAMDKAASNPKRLRKEPPLDLGLRRKGKDPFCWRCHKNVVASQQSSIGGIYCDTCPRSFHLKCIKQGGSPHWQCPECNKVVKAENLKTRSPSLRSMDLDHLCSLLKFALKRMVQVADSEPFVRPVNEKECPDYRRFIVHPMDLSIIQKNIENNVYGSTNAFESDTKWILHNSIIYNSCNSNVDQSKLTSTAKYIEKICKQEMIEIENCSNCYLNANTKESWFVEVCPKPHLLIWAKLKGFPYWPAKAMTNRFGMVDVRFFGAHDRAWVSYKDCYLYSQRNPNMHQMKKYNINECIMEVDVYIENLRKKFGIFKYAPFKAPFDPDVDHLPLFLPKYAPPNGADVPLKRLRSESKSSISSVRSLASVTKDLSKELFSDEDHDHMNDVSRDNLSLEITEHDMTKPEITEKSEPEEKMNNNLEVTEESKPLKSLKPEVKITDKLFNKLVKPDEETAVEKEEDPEKKGSIDAKKSTEKLDYEENDLLEVLYAEGIDGSKLDCAKKDKKVKINGVTNEKSLIIGIKGNINKALAISKNIKSFNPTETAIIPEEKKGKEEKISRFGSTNEAKKDNAKTETAEKTTSVDISIDAVARGFAKIKAINEINQAINVIRPDSLLKNKRSALESKKIVARRNTSKSDKSDEDLEIIDWCLQDASDPNVEVSMKRKMNFDSNNVNANKHVEDEVIIIKCESKAEEKAATAKKRKSLLEIAVEKAKELVKIPPGEETCEKKRELFHALEISAVGAEQEKPKINEIRTRSKTEEKIANAGFTLKQRARKSFPNTKSPNVYKGKKDVPVPPLFTTNRILKQITSSSLMVNNPPVMVSSGLSTTTPTTQSLVLLPAPLLFQSAQLGGPNTGQILAMVTSGNSPYTFVSQGSTFLNGNINLALGNDKIQAGSNQPAIESRPESTAPIVAKVAESPKISIIAENTTADKVPVAAADVASACEVRDVSNDANRINVSEKPAVTVVKTNMTLPKGKVVDKQLFNTNVSEPLNPTEFNILNGIVNESVPKAFSDILSRPPPTLKPRPPGPLSAQFDTGVPSSAGPWTARINSISHRLSDYLRGMLIETLNDVSTTTENPEALITTLQLEIESLKSRNAEEILEIKKNVNSLLQDIQKSIIEEKEKVVAETRSSCEAETIRRVEEAKSKQWCANCMKEAQFYCCWNTSYCDYPCQTKHWPKHMSKCTQNSQSQNSAQMGIMKGSQQIVLRPVMAPKGFTGGKPLLAKPAKIIMSKPPPPIPMNIVRTSSASGIALVESKPGSFELISNGQIADGNIINTPIRSMRKIPVSMSTISTTSSASKTIILQSMKSPVMSSTTKSQEKQSTIDPLLI